MAEAMRNAGQLEQSLQPMRQAAAMNPDDANLQFDLGLTLLRCVRHPEAEAPLQRAIKLKPNFPKALYALAEVHEALGRIPDAIAALRRAIEYSPKFTDAHRMLGALLHRVESLDEARECFRRAAIAGRNTTLGRICESFVLTETGQFGEAAEVLRRAQAHDPTNGTVCTTLGHVLANMGDIDGAIAQFTRALTLPGRPIGSWAALAQIRKITEADRPLVAEMDAYLRRESLVPRDRMMLNFTLGKAHDDLRDYPQAMQYYDAANETRRLLHPPNYERLRNEVDAMIAQYTQNFFAEHRGDGLRDETPLLVVGMPRSGTTLVEQILSCHQQIAGAGELTFWRAAWRASSEAQSDMVDAALARRRAGEYIKVLRSFSPSAARIVDKGLVNLYRLGFIMHALPDTRIVHCRRHPIDTCLSIYFTYFETISEFVADRNDLVFYYREYLRIMEHWRSVLPPERFFEVDYEDLIARPEETARELVEFCGLPWDPACLHPEDNQTAVRTASLWQVRQPIYRTSVERWRRYERWLGSLRALMPPEIK